MLKLEPTFTVELTHDQAMLIVNLLDGQLVDNDSFVEPGQVVDAVNAEIAIKRGFVESKLNKHDGTDDWFAWMVRRAHDAAGSIAKMWNPE